MRAATEWHPHSLLLFLHRPPRDCWEYHNVLNLLGLIHPEIALCSQVEPQTSRCPFLPTQEWVLQTDCSIKDRWNWSSLPHLVNDSHFLKHFLLPSEILRLLSLDTNPKLLAVICPNVSKFSHENWLFRRNTKENIENRKGQGMSKGEKSV